MQHVRILALIGVTGCCPARRSRRRPSRRSRHRGRSRHPRQRPFDAPPALLEGIRKQTFDTTGGNSGSPTLDARGELVGLLVDGNIERVASDVVWNGALTRSIHLEIRYAAWVMTALDHADALAAELGIAR